MKQFFNFLNEAKESQASMQARRLGLKGDGHGGWYDNQGEFVAKTEGGELKFYNKGQKVGERDKPQKRTQANQQVLRHKLIKHQKRNHKEKKQKFFVVMKKVKVSLLYLVASIHQQQVIKNF